MADRPRHFVRIKTWRENPKRFLHEELKMTLDRWQEDACEPCGGEWNPRRRLALRACTGPGKSALLAGLGWHRLACFGELGEHPKGAALSGEGRDNLRDNLWSELGKWRDRSEFLKAAFEFTGQRIHAKDHSETWFLSARSYPKDANAQAIGSALSGLHSRFPFLLLDEVGNMPIAVGQKASQIFTGNPKDALIAAAGNPTSPDGLLYEICVKQAHLWRVITITADPDDPKRTPRVDIEHAREMIKLYGRENPWVMATILGQFPAQGFNKLLSLQEVEAAVARHHNEEDYKFSQKRIGIDCARFGDDRTPLFPRQGLAAFTPVVMRGARGHEIAARLAVAKEKWDSELEIFDDTGGWASSAIDYYEQAGYTATSVNSSSTKTFDPRMFNRRAEMLWAMAEWVKKGGSLPDEPELPAELVEPSYTFKDGRLLIEPKEIIKKRLGRSPDLADALGLTFALPDAPGKLAIPFTRRSGRLKHDYNPLEGADYNPLERD